MHQKNFQYQFYGQFFSHSINLYWENCTEIDTFKVSLKIQLEYKRYTLLKFRRFYQVYRNIALLHCTRKNKESVKPIANSKGLGHHGRI